MIVLFTHYIATMLNVVNTVRCSLDYRLHIVISLDACPPFIPSVLQVPTKVDDENRTNFTLVCHAVDWATRLLNVSV